MLIGAHQSIAGGVHLALGRAEADGCESLQIFTTHNARWAARPLPHEEASLFHSEADRLGLPVLSHTSYLINLASPDPDLRTRSLDALTEEVLRSETLGVDGVVLHPGSHMGDGEDKGLERVARCLGELHRRLPGFRARVLLENTAGQGNGLGRDLAHLGRLLSETHQGERLGVCLDTCHALAAGYELRDEAGYTHVFETFEREIGLPNLRAFHLNDSKRELGSRVDRHDHIGEGELGLGPFQRLVNDARFEAIPGVSELPPDVKGGYSFRRNVDVLKGLRTSTSTEPLAG